MRHWPWQARSRSRPWLIGLAVLLCLLLAGRLAAPALIEKFVEASLADMPDGYRGTMEGVDVRLLSAEIALVGLRIEKKNGRVPVPFMHVNEFVIDTERDGWMPRTVLRLQGPTMNYVDADSEADKQSGPPFDLKNLSKQLPFELSRVQIRNGTVHFRNYQAKPALDAYVRHLQVDWRDLIGCLPPGSGACRSRLEGEATAMEQGKLELRGHFRRAPTTDFDLRATLRGLQAKELGPLLAHYAEMDVHGGEIALDAHYERKGQSHSALLVPRFHDLEVMGSERKDTRLFRQVALATAAGWFERKRGEKAIAIESKAGSDFDFRIVDVPRPSADRQKM